MKFINRHVLYHTTIVLIASLLLYWAIVKIPGSSLLIVLTIVFILAIPLSTYLNNRADQYQGFFGFNYHLVTYIICVGFPLLLNKLKYIPDASFIGSMALSWGIGLLIHLIIFIILSRKRKIGNYDKREIFQ